MDLPRVLQIASRIFSLLSRFALPSFVYLTTLPSQKSKIIGVVGLLLCITYSVARILLPRPQRPTIGFLHPRCLDGGGGERVLWCAVLAVNFCYPSYHVVVYSEWDQPNAEVGARLRAQFGFDAVPTFEKVPIPCKVVEAQRYPRLTLLLQSLGAILLGARAYMKHPANVFVDTANLAFANVVPSILGARTMSYVHYPTISTDMLQVVRTRTAQFNNSQVVAQSSVLSNAKLLYYKCFAYFYALAALFCRSPIANSSWTYNHLRALWWNENIVTLYPPCLKGNESCASDDDKRDDRLIVSLGQFRPEKNHELQLEALAIVAKLQPESKLRLLMIGGARNNVDKRRAEELQKDAIDRNLPVTVKVNATRTEVVQALQSASIGIHTMRDEHFGISVVELQRAGLITLAHRSGGVALDIVQDGVTGFLVDTAEDYAQAILHVTSNLGNQKRAAIRKASRDSTARFSDENFMKKFIEELQH